MNTHGKTRFACRVARIRDAMTGSSASGHIARCADCQAYYRADHNLINQLRQTAPKQLQPTPDDLAQRIARAVRQTAPQPARRRSPTLSWAALAGVSAVAVVALSLFIVRQTPTKSATQTANINQTTALTISPADVTELVENVDSLRSRLVASVKPTAETLVEKNPLTQELNSVRADARSALGFLALNFLPSESARQLESRIDPTRS